MVHSLQGNRQGDVGAELALLLGLSGGLLGGGVRALVVELVAPASVQLDRPAAGREVEPVLSHVDYPPQGADGHD